MLKKAGGRPVAKCTHHHHVPHIFFLAGLMAITSFLFGVKVFAAWQAAPVKAAAVQQSVQTVEELQAKLDALQESYNKLSSSYYNYYYSTANGKLTTPETK